MHNAHCTWRNSATMYSQILHLKMAWFHPLALSIPRNLLSSAICFTAFILWRTYYDDLLAVITSTTHDWSMLVWTVLLNFCEYLYGCTVPSAHLCAPWRFLYELALNYFESHLNRGVVLYRPGRAKALPMFNWALPIPLWALPITDVIMRIFCIPALQKGT